MNNDQYKTDFEELFRDFSEKPSSKCWESISNKLDVVLPVNSSIVTSSTSASTKFFGSIIGKSIAIITSTVIVGVAVLAVIYLIEPSEINKNNPSTDTKIDTTVENSIKQSEIATSKDLFSQKTINPSSSITTTNEKTTDSENSTAYVVNHSTNTITEIASKPTTPPTIQEVDNYKNTEPFSDNEVVESLPENSYSTPKEKELAENKIIIPKTNIVFPNVFTPNGDGYNDHFVIQNIEQYPNNRLVIVNTNGMKVFESNNYQNNWDGSNVGNGTYFFVFETKVEGVPQTFYGNIQIIR